MRRSIAVGLREPAAARRCCASARRRRPRAATWCATRSRFRRPPTGLFVSGFVSDIKPEHGWLNCHARYFVVSQPSLTALQVESVAASVPIMQVQIFKDRPEVLRARRGVLLEELADEIAVRLEKLPR